MKKDNLPEGHVGKFRTNKVKHEHTIIEGLRPVLDRMAACPAIQSIIPGPIGPHHSGRPLSLTIQYETETGLKLLARSGSAVQEVFLVAPDRAAVREWLMAHGLVEERAGAEPPPPPAPARKGPGAPGKQVTLLWEQVCGRCGRPLAPGSRAVREGRPPEVTFYHVRCFRRE